MEFLNKCDVLLQFQSGFHSGHQWKRKLTFMSERWLRASNHGNIVGTIMVDFRKACDLVDLSFLLKTGIYIHWLKVSYCHHSISFTKFVHMKVPGPRVPTPERQRLKP